MKNFSSFFLRYCFCSSASCNCFLSIIALCSTEWLRKILGKITNASEMVRFSVDEFLIAKKTDFFRCFSIIFRLSLLVYLALQLYPYQHTEPKTKNGREERRQRGKKIHKSRYRSSWELLLIGNFCANYSAILLQESTKNKFQMNILLFWLRRKRQNDFQKYIGIQRTKHISKHCKYQDRPPVDDE